MTGLSTYVSLFVASSIGFFTIIYCFWWLAPANVKASPLTITALLASVCAPVCPLVLTGILSEPLFATFLFVLAASLSRWPSAPGIVSTMLCCLAAFGVRYVGIVTFPMVALYALVGWRSLRQARRVLFFLSTYLVASVVCALLCYSNYRYFGRVAGPQPVGHESLWSWPSHLASFGWSPVAAFLSSAILEKLGGISNPLAFCAGLIVVGAIGFWLARILKRPSTTVAAPMVLLVVCYSLAIVTLRSITPFDAVSSARTFLPVMFPLAFLVVTEIRGGRSRLISLFAILLVCIGIALAIRGMSKQLRPGIREARNALSGVIQPGQSVAVNSAAISVAAYFENHFLSIGESPDGLTPGWEPTQAWDPHRANLVLYAVSPGPKEGGAADHRKMWEELSRTAIASGQARELAREDTFVLLESISQAAQKH
jgi:hypothetical protein